MRKRIIISSLVAVAAVLFVSGCGDAEAPATTEPTGTLEGAVATDGGSYRVRLTPAPAPPPLNEHFTLTVEVEGAPEGAEVVVDADMPEHKHGMNTKPVVAAAGSGRYDVTGFLFHMPGHWEIYVDVTKDGRTERATFPYDVED